MIFMSEENIRQVNPCKDACNGIRVLILRFRELILYGIIGSISSGLDFTVFTLLTKSGIYYVVANICSVLVGIVTSFIFNRKYNFKVKDKTVKRFTIFLSVGLMGLVLSTAILWLLYTRLGMNELTSKLISIAGVVVVQFLLNKYITFRNKSDKRHE